MTDAGIAALPVADLIHPEGAWIALWVTSPKLYAPQNSKTVLAPDVVARRWGARYSGRGWVWVKLKRGFEETFDSFINVHTDLHTGMGYTTRKCCEDVLLFRAGKPKRLARDVHEVILAPAREHSRKPDEVFQRIERFAPGPYVELFARETRAGWDAWGDQVDRFEQSEAIPYPRRTSTRRTPATRRASCPTAAARRKLGAQR
jgi:N6-adenosine-specific RNA methylase IME4